MADDETRLPPGLDAPRRAREFLRHSLGTVDFDGVREISELLTSELIANVVRHTESSAMLRLIIRGSLLRVEVDDDSTRPPVLRGRDLEATSGNGLLLVDALATRWGTDLRSDGKTVWFEIEVISAAPVMLGASR